MKFRYALLSIHEEDLLPINTWFSVFVPAGIFTFLVPRIGVSILLEGTGELLLANGEVAVTAQGKYLKMPLDKIAEDFDRNEEWRVLQPEETPGVMEV